FEAAGMEAREIIVRLQGGELQLIGARELQEAIAPLEHPRGAVARSHDILRAGALRLHEAEELDLDLEEASFGTARNGNVVPATIRSTAAFWRIVGLYLAEGHAGAGRVHWCFHPRDEDGLVAEVARFWHGIRVSARVFG